MSLPNQPYIVNADDRRVKQTWVVRQPAVDQFFVNVKFSVIGIVSNSMNELKDNEFV